MKYLVLLVALMFAVPAYAEGAPLGWVYQATADTVCNRSGSICTINGTVEAHSRPDLKSPVVAIFKGGTTSAMVQKNIPHKWNYFVLQCNVVRNPDNSLSCAKEQTATPKLQDVDCVGEVVITLGSTTVGPVCAFTSKKLIKKITAICNEGHFCHIVAKGRKSFDMVLVEQIISVAAADEDGCENPVVVSCTDK